MSRMEILTFLKFKIVNVFYYGLKIKKTLWKIQVTIRAKFLLDLGDSCVTGFDSCFFLSILELENLGVMHLCPYLIENYLFSRHPSLHHSSCYKVIQ